MAMKIAMVRANPTIEPPTSCSRVVTPPVAVVGAADSYSKVGGAKSAAWSPGGIPARDSRSVIAIEVTRRWMIWVVRS